MQRNPAVSDSFYAGNSKKLELQVRDLMSKADVPVELVRNAVSYVAPHAGYKYSGGVAAFTYKALGMKKGLEGVDSFVIVGPNHTGLGYPISVSAADWKTPLGTVENDIELSKGIADCSEMITIDEQAHRMEHSIEVQLPFLQEVVEKPRCCFICMGDQSLEYCKALYLAISESAKRLGRRIVVIASSDFNHYESASIAQRKDMPALKELESLRFERFHRRIEESGDSACGYGPVTVSAMFAKGSGARSGVVLRYSNSGDVTGEYDSVVAYSSMAFA